MISAEVSQHWDTVLCFKRNGRLRERARWSGGPTFDQWTSGRSVLRSTDRAEVCA